MQQQNLPKPGAYREYAPYSAIGIQIAVSFAVFTLGGNWLDEHYATRPLFLLIGLAAAIISMGTLIWKMVKMIDHNSSKNKSSHT